MDVEVGTVKPGLTQVEVARVKVSVAPSSELEQTTASVHQVTWVACPRPVGGWPGSGGDDRDGDHPRRPAPARPCGAVDGHDPFAIGSWADGPREAMPAKPWPQYPTCRVGWLPRLGRDGARLPRPRSQHRVPRPSGRPTRTTYWTGHDDAWTIAVAVILARRRLLLAAVFGRPPLGRDPLARQVRLDRRLTRRRSSPASASCGSGWRPRRPRRQENVGAGRSASLPGLSVLGSSGYGRPADPPHRHVRGRARRFVRLRIEALCPGGRRRTCTWARRDHPAAHPDRSPHGGSSGRPVGRPTAHARRLLSGLAPRSRADDRPGSRPAPRRRRSPPRPRRPPYLDRRIRQCPSVRGASPPLIRTAAVVLLPPGVAAHSISTPAVPLAIGWRRATFTGVVNAVR